MKYIILLGDGMADYPLEEVGGRTPLEVASTPNMDRIAGDGSILLIDTIPKGMTPGSDVANLAVLGYDPSVYHTGRGPLEAASMGVKLSVHDVAFRCNLVTLSDDERMVDFTADHISSGDGAELIGMLNEKLGTTDIHFYAGVGYRHLMVWTGGNEWIATTPPHDITGQSVVEHLPHGEGSDVLRRFIAASREFLTQHPVNKRRMDQGKRPATSIWPWGQGKAPRMTPLTERYGITGGVISAVDLIRGIGYYAGLENIPVTGATGYTDTNYLGKAEAALHSLRKNDFVFLHVEAPDEMGHEGNIQGKITAIEDFDRDVVGTVLEGIPSLGEYRVAVLSDHPTPIVKKTHVSDPSPLAVISSRDEENLKTGVAFHEKSAASSGLMLTPGHQLMEYFLGDWRSCVGRSS